MQDTIETLAYRVKTLEDKAERNSEEHGKFYTRIETIENGHSVMQNDISNIKQLCSEIKADVKDLKERPSKRWEGLVNSVVQWLALALLAAYTALK